MSEYDSGEDREQEYSFDTNAGEDDSFWFGDKLKTQWGIPKPPRTTTGSTKRQRDETSLDPILNAGAIKIAIIKRFMSANFSTLPWVEPIYNCLCKETATSTTMKEEPILKQTTFRQTMGKYQASIQQLVRWKVMKPIRHVNLAHSIIVPYFEITKADGSKARALTDCRATNAQTKQPPKLTLIEMETLFLLINQFQESHFVTLDYKNWFYQIPLAETLHKYITIMIRGNTYQMCVWPQGLNWSPAVAQTIAWIILLQERDETFQIGLKYAGPGPPTHAEVYSDDKLIGLITIWYDNILIIADSPGNRDKLNAFVHKASNRCNAVIKETIPTSHTVKYGGIVFGKEGTWQHDKREKWPTVPTTTPRGIARIIGIMTRDWYVSGEPTTDTFAYLNLASWLGQRMAYSNEWDATIEFPPDKRDHWKAVLQRYQILRQHSGWRQRRLVRTQHEQGSWTYLASDANLNKGAWVELDKAGTIVCKNDWYWNTLNDEICDIRIGTEENAPINRLEIMAALICLNSYIEKATNNTIVIAIDNTTAVKATQINHYKWNLALSTKLLDLKLKSMSFNVTIFVVWVSTKDQPADHLTRNVGHDAKCNARCLEQLMLQGRQLAEGRRIG